MYDQLIAAFRLDNTPLLAISALTFLFGYLEYVYSFALTFREKRAPYPVWMHTFYLAHDSTWRSEEHTSELQSLIRNSYAVFCLKKKNTDRRTHPAAAAVEGRRTGDLSILHGHVRVDDRQRTSRGASL